MASFQQEKSGAWTARLRTRGIDEAKSGFKTKAAAKQWATGREKLHGSAKRPRGKGARGTTVAEALLHHAQETLPFKKGAEAEVNRINVYLRLARLPTLEVIPCASPREAVRPGTQEPPRLVHFEVKLVPVGEEPRRVVASLQAHRARLDRDSEGSMRVRKRLAHLKVAEVGAAELEDLVRARALEGAGASTIRHDVHILRSMINRVRKAWNWSDLARFEDNEIELPALPPGRTRVLSSEEEVALAGALRSSYNERAIAALGLLVETSMRAAEALQTVRWRDVRWDASVLDLREAKTGPRLVPLSGAALAILRALPSGAPDEPIFGLSYEAIKAVFARACERAGLSDLHLQDLRHTGATRACLRLNGNLFLLMLVTGHKTLSQLQRYVNPTARDAVRAFQATDAQTPHGALAQSLLGEAPRAAEDAPRVVAQQRRAATPPDNVILRRRDASGQRALAGRGARAAAPGRRALRASAGTSDTDGA